MASDDGMAAGMHASPLLEALTGPGAGAGAGAGCGAGAGVVGFVGAEGAAGAAGVVGMLAEAGVVPLEELLLDPQALNAKAREKQANCASTVSPCE
jgi:hypothetical protein